MIPLPERGRFSHPPSLEGAPTMRLAVRLFVSAALLLTLAPLAAQAADWTRFRGPNGSGVTADAAPPTEWSDEHNLAWKVELPGPGSSSPIVVGDKVLLTCWTGYGVSREEPGEKSDLVRHLFCFDRNTGDVLWRAGVPTEHADQEETYEGMFAEHGYTSHTPVSDGERVYAFFGRDGAIAYDLEGNELWRADCGQGAGDKEWGSAASPILHDDLVIIAALAESNALIALDKATGEEAWRFELEGLNGVWSTPVLATSESGRTDLILAAPFKMVGLDPNTGEELWHCGGIDNDTVSTSPVVAGDTAYILAGRGGSLAVRAGGEGDITESHLVWRGAHRGGIGTPIHHDGRIYFVNRDGMSCIDAATGDRVYQARFERPKTEEAPAEEAQNEGGQNGEGGGRRGRGRDWARSMTYSSPVVAGDTLYTFTRSGDAYVVRLGEEFEQLAVNQFEEGGDFSGTPALADGALYMRSSQALYCIKAN